MKKIDFIPGQFGYKIENINEYQNSIFKDAYDNAFKSIVNILENSNNNEYNNIIAFIGDRGAGKTSTMLSFEKLLLNGGLEKDKNIVEYKFCSLNIIDPSYFSLNSNILEIIISSMFKEFQLKQKRVKDESEERKILNLFKKIYKNISIIENKYEFDGENFDKLFDLSSSVDLKENLNELISVYLKFMNENDKEKNILLIKIDDIDLNTKYAYKMIEQIRKYLIQNNIIILMALKLDQLAQVIKVNYSNEFKDKITNLECEQMAYKYLEKLIPPKRRIQLDTITKSLKKINLNLYEKEYNDKISAEEKLREFLYKKLRISFLDDKVKDCPILSKNLRELINFINLFFDLEDIDYILDSNNVIKKEHYEIFVKNISIFNDYFFKTWIEYNLNEKHKKILKELDQKNVGEKNRYIITKIFEEIPEKTKINMSVYNKLENINEYGFISTNISLGDVLDALSRLIKIKVDIEDENYIFAIKTIYSKYLYEYYLEYKLNQNNKDEKYTDYEIFIGGEIFLSENILYAPEKLNEISTYSLYEDLKNLFIQEKDMITSIQNISNMTSEYQKKIKIKFEETQALIIFIFFLKDVNAPGKRISQKLDNFRKVGKIKEETYYNGTFDLALKPLSDVIFDISSPLFFGLSSFRTLKRYTYGNDNLFNLLERINKEIEKVDILKKFDLNPFEDICFRNIDVIEKLFTTLKLKSSKNKFEIIKDFYKKIKDNQIEISFLNGPLSYKKRFEKICNYFENEIFENEIEKILNYEINPTLPKEEIEKYKLRIRSFRRTSIVYFLQDIEDKLVISNLYIKNNLENTARKNSDKSVAELKRILTEELESYLED